MCLIEARYTGDAPVADRLELDFNTRSKSRLRARLVSGAEVGLFLPRGTILRGRYGMDSWQMALSDRVIFVLRTRLVGAPKT